MEYLSGAVSSDASTRHRALDSLILATNQNDEQSKLLVDNGVLKIALDQLKKVGYPSTSNPCWKDDSAPENDHPDWWLAFDILTNLCKWCVFFFSLSLPLLETNQAY